MHVHALTARELLELLERGELSSVEIVRALHARSDRVEPEVNGFVHQFREQALGEARRCDESRSRGERLGPLHGVPLSVKESIDTRGVSSTLGMKSRLGEPAEVDAVVVRLAKRAGGIVLGKTNVPQTLLSPKETTNHIWGTSHNPWKLSHGPGGSSGGEGVVLSTGQSPLGIGTDIGGSIRFPSGFCGVVGLKPTLHRWSNVGCRTAIVGQEVVRSQVGPMARTTADLSLFLRTLDTPSHSPFDPSVPPLPIEDPHASKISEMRIGWYEDDGFFEPAASVRRAVREAVSALRDAGATLVEFEPPNAADVVYLMLAAVSSDGGQTLDDVLAGEEVIDPLKLVRTGARLPGAARKTLARAARAMKEPRLAKMLEVIGRKPVEELWRITGRRTAYQMAELAAWGRAEIDALVCPLHVTTAVPQGMSKDFTLAFGYAARYNVLNLPAGAVPVTRVRSDELRRPRVLDRLDRRAAEIESRSQGLPVPVQVVGPPWREDRVLAVMQAIEDAARQTDEFPFTPVEPGDPM